MHEHELIEAYETAKRTLRQLRLVHNVTPAHLLTADDEQNWITAESTVESLKEQLSGIHNGEETQKRLRNVIGEAEEYIDGLAPDAMHGNVTFDQHLTLPNNLIVQIRQSILNAFSKSHGGHSSHAHLYRDKNSTFDTKPVIDVLQAAITQLKQHRPDHYIALETKVTAIDQQLHDVEQDTLRQLQGSA